MADAKEGDVYERADRVVAAIDDWTTGINELAASDYVFERRDEMRAMARHVSEVAAFLRRVDLPVAKEPLEDSLVDLCDEAEAALLSFRWLLEGERL